MSWEILVPVSGKISNEAAVIATCNPQGRYCQTLKFTVRPNSPAHKSWWRGGQLVQVEVGAGEHSGKIRVRPVPSAQAGSAALHTLTGVGPQGRSVALRLNSYPGLPAGGHKQTSIKWTTSENVLQMELPGWVGAVSPVKNQPFVGVGSTGHTETFAARRGSSSVR